MKMEQTECSETSAYKIQTPGNYPEENIQQIESYFLDTWILQGFMLDLYDINVRRNIIVWRRLSSVVLLRSEFTAIREDATERICGDSNVVAFLSGLYKSQELPYDISLS
jgi:hypothetical protein